MYGKIKYFLGFFLILLGHVLAFVLYMSQKHSFVFAEYLHSESLNLIAYPATFFGIIFGHLLRKTDRLDWFGQLLLGILLIGWLILVYLFMGDLYPVRA